MPQPGPAGCSPQRLPNGGQLSRPEGCAQLRAPVLGMDFSTQHAPSCFRGLGLLCSVTQCPALKIGSGDEPSGPLLPAGNDSVPLSLALSQSCVAQRALPCTCLHCWVPLRGCFGMVLTWQRSRFHPVLGLALYQLQEPWRSHWLVLFQII